jgi:hypothetical protein
VNGDLVVVAVDSVDEMYDGDIQRSPPSTGKLPLTRDRSLVVVVVVLVILILLWSHLFLAWLLHAATEAW